MPSGQTSVTHRLAESRWLFLAGKAIYKQHRPSSFPTSCLRERAEYTAQAGLPNKQLQRNSTEKQPMSAHSEIRNQAGTDRTAGNRPSRGQALARHCPRKVQTTKPSSGPRGAHAYFRVYFYLMLSTATF